MAHSTPRASGLVMLALLVGVAASAAATGWKAEVAGQAVWAGYLLPGETTVLYEDYFFSWDELLPLTYAMTSAGDASPVSASILVRVCRPWALCETQTIPAAAAGQVDAQVYCCSLDPTHVRVSFRAGPAPVAYLATQGPLVGDVEACPPPPAPPPGVVDFCPP